MKKIGLYLDSAVTCHLEQNHLGHPSGYLLVSHPEQSEGASPPSLRGDTRGEFGIGDPPGRHIPNHKMKKQPKFEVDDFTLEDIRKIRTHIYQITKDMTEKEKDAYTRKCVEKVKKEFEQLKKQKHT